MLNIKIGVTQNSILGPLLFTVYINVLLLSASLLDPIMFADDTSLFHSHHDMKELLF